MEKQPRTQLTEEEQERIARGMANGSIIADKNAWELLGMELPETEKPAPSANK